MISWGTVSQIQIEEKKFLSLALSFFFFGALFLLLVMKGDSSVPAVQHIMIRWFNSSQVLKQSTSVPVETKTSTIVCGAQRCQNAFCLIGIAWVRRSKYFWPNTHAINNLKSPQMRTLLSSQMLFD